MGDFERQSSLLSVSQPLSPGNLSPAGPSSAHVPRPESAGSFYTQSSSYSLAAVSIGLASPPAPPGVAMPTSSHLASIGVDSQPLSLRGFRRNSNAHPGPRTRALAARWSTISVNSADGQQGGGTTVPSNALLTNAPTNLASRIVNQTFSTNLRRCDELSMGSNSSLSSGEYFTQAPSTPSKRLSQSPITVDTTADVLRSLASPESNRASIVYPDADHALADSGTLSRTHTSVSAEEEFAAMRDVAVVLPATKARPASPSSGPMRLPVQRSLSRSPTPSVGDGTSGALRPMADHPLAHDLATAQTRRLSGAKDVLWVGQ